MAKDEDKIQVEGLVVEALPGTQFRCAWIVGMKYWLTSQVKCVNITSGYCSEIGCGLRCPPTI